MADRVLPIILAYP